MARAKGKAVPSYDNKQSKLGIEIEEAK